MKGHLRLVVDRAFVELWQPLTDHDDCPRNVFGEIYAGISPRLRESEPEYVREDDGTIRDISVRRNDLVARAVSDPETAETLLSGLAGEDFESELAALSAISSTFDVLCDVANEDLAARFLDLLRAFVARYSLRYYVDAKAGFWISFSGLATALFGQIRLMAASHPHVDKQLSAFEHALAECLADPVESRIKTTIQKQCNVLEAIGSKHHRVSGNTLGQIVEQVGSWPHKSLSDAARHLYKFASDYPGIRHGGTDRSASRELDLRDLASVTLSLVGLVAYLAEDFEVQIGAAIQGDLTLLGASYGAETPWPDAPRTGGGAQ